MLKKNREPFPVEIHGKIIFDDQNNPIMVQGVTRDISERRQAEEQLRKREEKYRNIFENVQDVYYETSLDGALLEISPSIEVISRGQYRRADLIGRQIIDFYADTEERSRLINKLIETGSASDFEILLHNKDGSLVTCSISAKLWRDDQGNPVKIIGSMHDISDRKQMEAEREKLQARLIQAHKMEAVGRLAGGVAHDYNNMLAVILGYTEMALEQTAPSDPIYADLKEVYNAGKRSMEITQQLLAFARKQTIAPKVLDLNETVEEMLKMLRRLIGEDIDLAWHPGASLWPVKMDPAQINQVLANLCINARDAIAGVGKITIETENIVFDENYCADHAGFVPGDFVMLAVSDNGRGMDRETLANLFEPFFTTKGVGEGTGLGLATIYGIVKQNYGFINVYSEPKKGSTFKIYLPHHEGQPASRPAVAHTEPEYGKGETILLVEDEPKIIKMSKMMLEKLGYHVLTAETPGKAVSLVSEYDGEIHLLITDVIMPEMNGRDLAEKLKALYPDLKILFMSGYTANVIAHHGVLDGGVHFIEKPFSRAELAGKVREAILE
jgi:two-component system, cell cycle sensor histidine kinase and response regulator CckA